MRKILTVALIICLLCFSVVYANSDTADSIVTRAEMVQKLLLLIDVKPAKAHSTTIFLDVTNEHPLSGFINAAQKRDLIEGNGDGTFSPDETVTFEQAIKMTLSLLGYNPVAQSRFDYPQGYLMTADGLGLSKGIFAKTNEPANPEDIQKILDRALTMPIMEQTGFGTYIEYTICNGENGAPFKTLESWYLMGDPIYITDRDNNIVLSHKDFEEAKIIPSSENNENLDYNLYSLLLTLTDDGNGKLANFTEKLLKESHSKRAIKIIASKLEGNNIMPPTIIANPIVNGKIDVKELIVEGQFFKERAEAIAEAINSYKKE